VFLMVVRIVSRSRKMGKIPSVPYCGPCHADGHSWNVPLERVDAGAQNIVILTTPSMLSYHAARRETSRRSAAPSQATEMPRSARHDTRRVSASGIDDPGDRDPAPPLCMTRLVGRCTDAGRISTHAPGLLRESNMTHQPDQPAFWQRAGEENVPILPFQPWRDGAVTWIATGIRRRDMAAGDTGDAGDRPYGRVVGSSPPRTSGDPPSRPQRGRESR
jgi:hypothetical protein